jgi:hypothetical protein
MKIFEKLKLATSILERSGCEWAICGGVAACLYRETPRYTGDIDFCLTDCPARPAIEIAREAAHALGYSPIEGFVTDHHGELVKGPALIVGREDQAGAYLGVDFLLPVLPWILPAVKRAQSNRLDYGFARLPTIVPEDLVVAKIIAFQGSAERLQDLDDIQSIVKQMKMLDIKMIQELCREYDVEISSEVKQRLRGTGCL